MVGISPAAVTSFEKGRRRISIDWLKKIADALDTPVAYFLVEGRGGKKIVPGDLREKRLLDAWRRLKGNPTLQKVFLRIMEHLGRSAGVKSRRR
jgi:transcriptional regulator with XRE-family HTH domain